MPPDQVGQGLRHRRHRILITVAAVLGLVALLAAVGWGVFFSPLLAARQVRVQGSQELAAEQVQGAAQVPLGVPLARQDVTAIARRTVALPQVAAARVTRDWPHTITITVTERQPLLAVAQPEGFALVDQSGVAYETRPAAPGGVLQAEVDPGNVPLLVEASGVASALPGDLRTQVRHLDAVSRDDITLTLRSGIVVTWGSSAESPLKAQLLPLLLKRHPRAAIDLSSPHDPAIR